MLSLSSPLLLRISPHTFAFISILPMCLSSLNRSIYAVSRHIMPYSAPLCKVLHYSKTGVPWQMKSTFIIVIVYFFLPGNDLFCKEFRVFEKYFLSLPSWQNTARWSKSTLSSFLLDYPLTRSDTPKDQLPLLAIGLSTINY